MAHVRQVWPRALASPRSPPSPTHHPPYYTAPARQLLHTGGRDCPNPTPTHPPGHPIMVHATPLHVDRTPALEPFPARTRFTMVRPTCGRANYSLSIPLTEMVPLSLQVLLPTVGVWVSLLRVELAPMHQVRPRALAYPRSPPYSTHHPAYCTAHGRLLLHTGGRDCPNSAPPPPLATLFGARQPLHLDPTPTSQPLPARTRFTNTIPTRGRANHRLASSLTEMVPLSLQVWPPTVGIRVFRWLTPLHNPGQASTDPTEASSTGPSTHTTNPFVAGGPHRPRVGR